MQFMGIWPQVREKDIHYINTIYSYAVVKMHRELATEK